MVTAIAAGLGATLGYAKETTVGTFLAPTHFIDFEKEALKYKKMDVQGKSLRGALYLSGKRRAVTTHTASGTIDLDLYDRGLGAMFAQMLGGTAPTPTLIGSTGVYKSVFVPGDTTGQTLSIQVGRPTTAGLQTAFSYNGCKITDWTIDVKNNALATFQVSVDAWNESLAPTYTAPSYVASNALHFAEATLLLGGTVTTTSGVTTVSGGTAVASCTGVTLKGTNAMATSRYFLGSSGTKAEQLANNFRGISGSADFEFANTTDVYAAFAADTPVTLQLSFVGPVVGTDGTTTSLVQFLIPQIRWEGDTPDVAGPDILKYTAPFTGFDDEAGDNPIQLTTQSLDTTL